ncbi:unnamed protein product [Caenorhabditis auriculariae]|uniref:RRM domain-containing protein n=1 Tax=Caenorhabditis auriculariae TaxID=2777116 RepID=A0A8S1HXQ1_9PELO|nr:unnamed protein product [Caenorhabditis auriculariae]
MGKSFMVQCRGLPWTCTDDELKKFFGNKGIDFVDIPKRNGKSTGEGLVCFNNEDDYRQALKKDKDYIGTRFIEVGPMESSRRPREDREERRESRRDRRDSDRYERPPRNYRPPNDGRPLPPYNGEGIVRLRGIPFSTHFRDIIDFFSPLHVVRHGVLLPNPDLAARRNGEAFVIFDNAESANLAQNRHMKNIKHRYIEVFTATMDELMMFCEDNDVRPPFRPPSGGGGYPPQNSIPPFANGPPSSGPAPYGRGPEPGYGGRPDGYEASYKSRPPYDYEPYPPAPRRDDPYAANAPAYPDAYDRPPRPRPDAYPPAMGRDPRDLPREQSRDPRDGYPPSRPAYPSDSYDRGAPAYPAAYPAPKDDYADPPRRDPDVYYGSFERRPGPPEPARRSYESGYDNWRAGDNYGPPPQPKEDPWGADPYSGGPSYDRLRQPYAQEDVGGPMRRGEDPRMKAGADPYERPPPRDWRYDRDERDRGDNNGNGPKLMLRMRGVPFRADEAELYEVVFAPCRPSRIEILRETNGRPSGEARVEFSDRKDYDSALLKDKQYLGSRYIELFPDYPYRY